VETLEKIGEHWGLIGRVKRREVREEEGWQMASMMKVIVGSG